LGNGFLPILFAEKFQKTFPGGPVFLHYNYVVLQYYINWLIFRYIHLVEVDDLTAAYIRAKADATHQTPAEAPFWRPAAGLPFSPGGRL
jgi:hypothetical protein